MPTKAAPADQQASLYGLFTLSCYADGMDMAFQRRAERLLAARQVVRLDHAVLVASLSAHRRPAADTGTTPMVESAGPAVEDPLVELLLAGPDWRRAISTQRGCFSRAEAGRRVNGS